MGDINKVLLTGQAVSQPILTRSPPKTPVTTFTLQVHEKFKNFGGKICHRPNWIRIESWGKAADITAALVKEGGRYIVEGFIRADRVDETQVFAVRSSSVQAEANDNTMVHISALYRALSLMEKSRDLPQAIQALKELLEEAK